MDCEVSSHSPLTSEKISIDLQWEKCCDHNSFKWIFFILAGNKDNHESLDEYEFPPDSTTAIAVSSP